MIEFLQTRCDQFQQPSGSVPVPICVMILRSLGDNHCQEDSRAKSAWRETRVFGGIGLFVLHCFLLLGTSPPFIEDSWPPKEGPIKSYPNLSLIDPNLFLPLFDQIPVIDLI
jgi:hypothetical protein